MKYCILSYVQKFSFLQFLIKSDSTQAKLFTTALFQPDHKAYLINGLGP